MTLAHDSLSPSLLRYLYGEDVPAAVWGSRALNSAPYYGTNGSLCSSPEVLWNDEPLASLSNCPSTKAPMPAPSLN